MIISKLLLAKPATEENSAKPLFEHMIETGIFAQYFLLHSAYSSTFTLLRGYCDIDGDALLSSICYLCAMHDIGKANPFFQYKIGTDQVRNLVGNYTDLSSLRMEDVEAFRHEIYSKKVLAQLHPDIQSDTKDGLLEAVGDHHQDKRPHKHDFPDNFDVRRWMDDMVLPLETEISSYFPFTNFNADGHVDVVCRLFSGILRCADWSASSFASDLSMLDGNYEQKVWARSKKFIEDGAVQQHVFKDSYTYGELFPELRRYALHPLQERMVQVVHDHPDVQCIIIEDQMGAGKTEAGLYAAMNLIHRNNKQGLYMALPTGATAEAMLPRIEALQRAAGLWDGVDVRLLTGTAWMVQGEDALDRATWTKSGPRKLFSSLSVGTVDQIMAAAENLRAGDLRMLGLSSDVIVIDEFHAYDAFMLAQLKVLLAWCREMKVPVVILSATLQKATVQAIMSVYAPHVAADDLSSDYPLITVAEHGKVFQYTTEPAATKKYTISLLKSGENIPEKILASVSTGGNTLCICNTVNRAIALYTTLKGMVSTEKICLYDARTNPANKKRIGEHLADIFGKEGKRQGRRPKGMVVVATQLMEMSMDVDFDTIFSDLAPIDILFQRIGREKRHDDVGTVREHGFKAMFYVCLPDKEKEDWALPYKDYCLQATEHVLTGRTELTLPEDIRECVEKVYTALNVTEGMKVDCTILAASAKQYVLSAPQKHTFNPTYALRLYTPVTRYSEYKMVSTLVLPHECFMKVKKQGKKVSKEACADMIRNYSVSLSKKTVQKLDGERIEDDNKPIYLADYYIIEQQSEYSFSPEYDGTFIMKKR